MNATASRISNVQQIQGMWFWTVTDDFGEQSRMRINSSHEGIWCQWSETEWRQTTGTCQFSLAGKSPAAVRAYLRRQFA